MKILTNLVIAGYFEHKGTAIPHRQLTLNQKVGGSIPSWRTKKSREIKLFGIFLISDKAQKEVKTGLKRLQKLWKGCGKVVVFLLGHCTDQIFNKLPYGSFVLFIQT